ncbi:MAG: nitrile hydratase subunit beta [Alphaproteobacteria bacterium]|nr:nitrile hydratase subunit beta [Alphaproteobacteria bacterium]
MSFAFQVGQRVRVKEGDPPGHIRTPFYLRGKLGQIESRQGEFRNPEELAYGKDGLPKRPLYLVRFHQTDVWSGYPGPATDTLSADIYEHWLDAEE